MSTTPTSAPTTVRATTRAREHLTWIREHWDQAEALKHRGTPLPWHEPTISAEHRHRLDAEARAEKLTRGAGSFGESPAPLHLAALDRNNKITTALRHAAIRADLELTDARPPNYQPAPWLDARDARAPALAHWLAGTLEDYAEHLTEDTTSEIARTATRSRRALERATGNVVDGQRLKAACPWCHAEQLMVRHPHNGDPLVVCESGTCDPGPSDCGTWWRGRPSWPQHEWDWLAARIDHHGPAHR